MEIVTMIYGNKIKSFTEVTGIFYFFKLFNILIIESNTWFEIVVIQQKYYFNHGNRPLKKPTIPEIISVFCWVLARASTSAILCFS
jgi:hypothetical protein